MHVKRWVNYKHAIEWARFCTYYQLVLSEWIYFCNFNMILELTIRVLKRKYEILIIFLPGGACHFSFPFCFKFKFLEVQFCFVKVLEKLFYISHKEKPTYCEDFWLPLKKVELRLSDWLHCLMRSCVVSKTNHRPENYSFSECQVYYNIPWACNFGEA